MTADDLDAIIEEDTIDASELDPGLMIAPIKPTTFYEEVSEASRS